MRQYNLDYFRSEIEVHKVKRIDFGILNPTEVAKMSVCKVENRLVYDGNGEPTREGLNDITMGPNTIKDECLTCRGKSIECPGHFGHIELAKPMFHVGFIEKVVRVLKCICIRCSKLLGDENDPGFRHACSIKDSKRRFQAIYNICSKIKRCRAKELEGPRGGSELENYHDGCGAAQPKRYVQPDKLLIQVEFDEEEETGSDRKRNMSAEEVLNIFKEISADDCHIMGFDPAHSRPEWMILTVIPVAPPCVRPSVTMDSTMRQDDDLTYQYRNIVMRNQELKRDEGRGRAQHTMKEDEKMLQFHLATLIDNELPGMPFATHKSGKRIKAIRARLRGKEGRLRGNLMGKRVDFSARSVITPDPNLALDQLGVPRTIAMNLTIPEVVSPLNKEFLSKLVNNGPYEWPGANYIIRDNKTRFCLRDPKKMTDTHLEYGYTVERHLLDDDFVIFNRQPSLHKMSMMGHRVKVLPYSSFRLNLSVTTPYNADFDGDEMNLHVPQSYETRAEVKEIMHVPRQIVSPQSNKPVMGIVQDSLVGMRLLTLKDTFIDITILMNLLLWIEDFDGRIPAPAIVKPKQLWTGKQLISLILPDVNLERLAAIHDTQFKFDTPINAMDSRVIIQKGQLLMGALCKRTVGNASGGLIHIIWSDFGPDRCKRFLSSAQLLVNNWLVTHGFTVGISDTISDEETSKEIGRILQGAKEKVKQTMELAQKGKLECQPGKNMLESFEAKINFNLNEARDTAGTLAMKSLSETNNVKMMVLAGSKGTNINISQIMSCVGQQNVEGKRIPFGFRHRTLPHFNKDDYGPECKGFVLNSYLSGLTPQEFYFHAMGGREGLIDTAVKTSETGYIQRRLIKSLEDVMVKYDGTVRNSMGQLLQFLYGEDGMSAEYIEDQKISILAKSDNDMKKNYELLDPSQNIVDELNKLKKYLAPKIIDEITNSPEMQYSLKNDFEMLLESRNELRREVFLKGEDKQHLPVNLDRIITTAKKKFNVENDRVSDLHPCTILDEVNSLLKKLIVVHGKDSVSMEAQMNGIKLFSIHLKSELSPKKLLCVDKMNQASLQWLIGEIESRFNQAIVAPGEMVGAIGAQSIGEPATQMTLNTFHFAGVSSKNVTLGVPRLKEVINVAKTIRTPSMTIFLYPDIASDQRKTKKVQSALEHTTLSHVAKSSEIYYDPDPAHTIISDDQSFVELHYSMEDDSSFKLSPWLLRIELNPDRMTDKDVGMILIQNRINNSHRKQLEVIASDINATKLILRIREILNNPSVETKSDDDSIREMNALKTLQSHLLNDLQIKGIPDIKKVYMRMAKKINVNDKGELVGTEKEWILETDGVNLKQVFLEPTVDFRRTYSNNIIEISEILGIEAVRQSLLRELRMVLDHYSIYVNYRHLAMLADLMTHRGILTSITRHGINRVESGPLRRCSFEETVEILMEAAVFAEKDCLKGITENIIMGQLCPLGTGYFDVLIDKSKLSSAHHIADPYEVAKVGEEEEEMLTPMQNSPGMQTPLYYTGPYQGATPRTPVEQKTPYTDPNRSFSPAYHGGFASSTYQVGSPTYALSENLRSPNYVKGPYILNSPAHPYTVNESSSMDSKSISSPNYSSEHSSEYSPAHSPLLRNSTCSPNSRFGQNMLSHLGRNHLSPLYSPTHQTPSYSPMSMQTISPIASACSGQYGPNSPLYNQVSPVYNPTSPNYNPVSPVYAPSTSAIEEEDLGESSEENTKIP